MTDENFKELVTQALSKLPEDIKTKMDNVAICVEETPSKNQLKSVGVRYGNNLLGLYEGIPQNAWGRGWGNNLPDKITIFKKSIETLSSNPKELEELIKDIVWHEIAHHFGFDEKEVAILEKKRENIKIKDPR